MNHDLAHESGEDNWRVPINPPRPDDVSSFMSSDLPSLGGEVDYS